MKSHNGTTNTGTILYVAKYLAVGSCAVLFSAQAYAKQSNPTPQTYQKIGAHTFDTNGDGINDLEIIVGDTNKDGTVDQIETRKFDQKGQVIELILKDGKEETKYAYDLKGRIIRRESHKNNKVYVNTFEYDSAGNESKRTVDSNGDGKIDQIWDPKRGWRDAK